MITSKLLIRLHRAYEAIKGPRRMGLLLCYLLLPTVLLAQDPSRFEKEVIVAGCNDPLQMDIAADGRVFFIERRGAVKMWEPTSRRTVTLGNFPASTDGDAGALGLALAPDFEKSGQLYTIRVPVDGSRRLMLARYTLVDGRLVDEREVLTVPLRSGNEQYHCGAGLAWDGQGDLLIGVGDNMPPQDVPAIHAEDTGRDSRGTAGNSKELRGKILRIAPKPDGSYGIPAGNLFSNAAEGRPEVYAFGVRNPFRVTCDTKTGLVIWGEVGANVRAELGLGPEGFDEVNATREPGFFGWPYCSGPNLPWRPFDPKTQKPAGDFFDVSKIINDSRANTGLRELPPARPAAFYYSNLPSKEWPFVGSGGRSVTGGVVYRRPATAGQTALPEEWEGGYIFGEWMRNWVAAARFDEAGKLVHAERVLADMTFKRPADFKIGPDGALYVAEYGERWTANTEGQISRVIYRRGNRPPHAVLTANRTDGKLPLEVAFDATGSRDPDGGGLTVAFDFGDGKNANGAKATHVFTTPGVWPVTVTVTDPQGASANSVVNIVAGNEAPQVKFTAPLDGGFLDEREVAWKVSAIDAEDGPLPADRLLVQMEKRDRVSKDDPHPGLCAHEADDLFRVSSRNGTKRWSGLYGGGGEVFRRSRRAEKGLSAKIISGGAGAWGTLPMPPHPQHTPAEAALMVDWVLSLGGRQIVTLPHAEEGKAAVPMSSGSRDRPENTVIFLTASAMDNGVGTLPALRGSDEVILRTRRQRAAFFDHSENAGIQDNLDQGGLVARIQPGGWIGFDRIRLQDFGKLKLSGWPQGSEPLKVTIFAGDARIGESDVSARTRLEQATARIHHSHPSNSMPPAPQQVRIKMEGPAGSVLDVMWVEFQRL